MSKCYCYELKQRIKEAAPELLIPKQLIRDEKWRESHRQRSEFQCYHKYLMALELSPLRGEEAFQQCKLFSNSDTVMATFLTEP